MVTNHQVTVSGLKAGTAYHFRVHSADANNNAAASADAMFTTGTGTTSLAVAISSPAANATVSGTVSVTATATDNVAVTSVQFQLDGVNVGAAATLAPYTFSWDTTKTSNGSHTLRAVATDSSNNAATSAAITVTVNNVVQDTTPPVVVITAPANNASVSGTITLTATATDPDSPVSFVQFQVDAVNTGSQVTASPYSITLDTTKLSNAVHQLTATAKDPAGNQGTSAAVAVTVNNAAPVPNISGLSPSTGAVGTSVTISGANFGATQGTSTVKFNGTAATPTSWSATSIVAPVPTGATTGNVVVTVGGVASNGVSFTVSTPGPSISGLSPSTGAVGTSVTISGANFGSTQGTSTVAFNGTAATPTSWSATSVVAPVPTGATTGNVVVTVGGMASNGVSFTVSTGTGSTMGPLKQSSANSTLFQDGSGKTLVLGGSQTWDDLIATGINGTTPAIDFTAYINFLKGHGHNATILRYRNLPRYCGFDSANWKVADAGIPWARSTTPGASDGGNKFDLNTLNQAFFDNVRAKALQASQNGIYVVVQIFDGNDLIQYRCGNSAPNGDGYPFTGVNNINGVDDGYTSGSSGTGSMTMGSNNAITNAQDAYVKKLIDTLNDLPNIVWEHSKEAPSNSTWWQNHLIGLIHTYEQGGVWEGITYPGKPNQHPDLYVAMTGGTDMTLYDSNADAIAPSTRFPSVGGNCGTGVPGCKVVMDDSDHSYFQMWLDPAQTNRQFIWENFTDGMNVLFMDPYLVYWSSGGRNLCDNNVAPSDGICTTVDTRWENFRNNLGYMVSYGNTQLNLNRVVPQPTLTSTGHCLADSAAVGSQFLVYAPSGGSFTVNLGAQAGRTLNVQWLDPTTGSVTNQAGIAGGNASQTFTPPWGSSYDAVLYLVDSAGHN